MPALTIIDHRIHDLRFAVRQLVKHRGFAATAILVLALGIAANVAIFAFVDAALVKPLPYTDSSRLTTVSGRVPRTRTSGSEGPSRTWISWIGDRAIVRSAQSRPTTFVRALR